MPEYLTYVRTVALLREVVAVFGADHVAPRFPDRAHPDDRRRDSCRYVVDGEPSCLVAHVLTRAGVDVTDLEVVESTSPDNVTVSPQFAAWADGPSLHLLAAVQEEQDNGVPWGLAVRHGIEFIEGGGDRG